MPTFEKFFRWLFSARILIRIGGGVLAFAVVAAVLWNAFDVSGHKRWLVWKADWEAKGESFDVASVIPAAISDEQNAAKSALFEPLFVVSMQNSEEAKKTVNRFKLDAKKKPGSKNWRLGESRNLADWEESILAAANSPEKGDTPADTILNALKPFEADLTELAEAMARPGCRFDIRYEDVFMALMPHLALLRDASQLYSLRASASLAKGDTDGAMSDVLLGIRTSELFADEPMLISQLVRVAILEMNLVPFCDGLHRQQWNDTQLAEFQKTIESIDLLEGTTLAFRGERNLVNMWFDQILEGTAKPASDSEMFVDPGWFVDLNRYHINRIITENLLARIDVEKHRVSMQGVPTAGEEMEQLTNVPFAWRYTFTTMLIPAYDKLTLKMTSAQAGLDQVMVAAALERHRLAKGGYPETLEELVPARLDKVPGDLFHENGLIYRTEGDTFALYSTGYNVKDDGGEFVVSEGKIVSIKMEEGDWPWPSGVAE